MEPYYGLIELTFSGGVVLGLAIWELIRVRRTLREDEARQADESRSADGSPDESRG